MNIWLGRLLVSFVLGLISFIAYSSQIFIIWPWYGNELSVPLLALLVPFNALVGMLLWNYFLCVITEPGLVPDSWQPDTHRDGYEVKKLTGKPRYCRSCKNFKPPRTHHCSTCNRCVLRMDHHCPWTNNCVGHYNYGHFIRFLCYVAVACSYHVAMVTRRVIDATSTKQWNYLPASELIFIILNYVACVPVLLSVGGFSIYHVIGLLGNSTTIEGWEKDKVATLVRRGRIQEVKFPYDLGWRKNVESVLGPNPLLWCCPTKPPGNGLRYEMTDVEDVELQAQWPPKDPRSTYENEEGRFVLPASPWTYDNGGINPELQPSTNNGVRRRSPAVSSSVPPYHPDYQQDVNEADSPTNSSDEEYYEERRQAHRPLVRRGSEGYEVRPVDREAMLQEYVQDTGRYQRYIPEPPSESEGSDEDAEENTPLAFRRPMQA